jgi:putative ABC transport system permease protein
MIRNYFRSATRNILRNKTTSFINLAGLSLGIATCLIIALFIYNELSYDRYHDKANRIVRVVFRGIVQGQKMNEAHVMPPVAEALKRDFPEVQESTRLRSYGYPRVSAGEKIFKESAFAYVDPNFFSLFTMPFVKGDKNTALADPHSIVISEELAEKYFKGEDAVGKILEFKDLQKSFKVNGVFKKIPEKSHFHFDMFASMNGLDEAKNPSWMVSEFYTYLVLPENYNYKNLEAKLPDVVRKYMGPQLLTAMGISFEQFEKNGNQLGLFLQPLTSIHLHSSTLHDLEAGGNIQWVYILSAIAVFMLIIACINFMNLSTAGASKRAREVGIRKVLGSVKNQLVKQFMMESLLMSFIAVIIAVVLVKMFLPAFTFISGKNISIQSEDLFWIIPALALKWLLTGMLAGSYPAFYLSSFKPVAVLKGKFAAGKSNINLRSGLVIFQFFISISLMICTAVVYSQLKYIQQKELGYDKEQVLVIPDTWMLENNAASFTDALRRDPRVISLSSSGYLPAGPSFNNNFFVFEKVIDDQIKTIRYDIDEGYIPTLGMKILAGRNFSREFGTDSSAVILNESAVKALGWKDNVIGKTIYSANNSGERTAFNVIGVVNDFHFRSMHEKISPLVMAMNRQSGTLIAKVNAQNVSSLLETVKKEWSAAAPGVPFNYSFLDDRFQATFQSEQKTATILGIFSGLTIFVACLGLFGLAIFTAEQRTKEIGIRKVLGASVSQIVNLLSTQFIKPVIIANLIAWPVSWMLMNSWLNDYAYRTGISWWIFIVVALIGLALTLFTISFQSVRSAIANPVDALKEK